ncbi:MAG: PQQ-binding-like beta-propeller repeat protein [Hyphomicrobiaceae bacterium]|nr:PQQ-binding-like beta-propeller repeat protein [Hyphomicrobiaceae bacterium]MCC0009471.1 PQQ-binding-like beta-propeller repeat protein [Hyphomicrobiaceae bacterium]
MGWKKIVGSIIGVGAVVGLAGAGVTYAIGSNPIFGGAMVLNYIAAFNNPPGEIKVELRKAAEAGDVAIADDPLSGQWASYNRTASADRFSPLSQITSENANGLKVLCTYDTGRYEAFETNMIMVEGALIGTTARDIFSINPENCNENWRVSRDVTLFPLPGNRGVAYIDGKVIRAFNDAYLRAFDVKTGKQLWETYLGDKNRKIWFTAAPVAANGMVFFGTAGGDMKDIRGRVYGLDANTGEVKWQTFTVPMAEKDTKHAPLGKMPDEMMRASWRNAPDVPISGGGLWTSLTVDPETGYLFVPVGNPAPDFVKSLRPGSNLFTNTLLVLDTNTGNYVKHFAIMPDDWHDWDVSNPPTLVTTRAGRKIVAFQPKDGHLYGFDRDSNEQLYRKPVTKVENVEEEFKVGKEVHFCPGPVGGGEWNSAAFDPRNNLIFTGQVEWCAKVKIMSDTLSEDIPDGGPWFGAAYVDPMKAVGRRDPHDEWGGWIYASDADSGEWAWRARTNYPIVGAVTPTAGGIVAFGDMGGNFYVMNANDGEVLWKHDFGGGIGGGVISYAINGTQRIAVAAGISHPVWPVWPTTGKIAVLGLGETN